MENAALRQAEAALAAKIDAELLKGNGQRAVKSVRASEIGYACDTYQALLFLKPEARPKHSLGLKKIFYIGRVLERPNMRLLQDAGIELVEDQRPLDWIKKGISGHLDGRIRIPDVSNDVLPLEHKTSGPGAFRAIKKIYDAGGNWKDLLDSKYTFLRKYPGQLQTYQLLEEVEHGAWFFFDKATGDYFFWICQLDYDYAETLVQRAERTLANVAAGKIPDPVRCDLCASCDFQKTFCFTGQDYGPGFDLMLSPEEIAEWEPKVTRYMEGKDAAKENEDLYEEIKEYFKGRTALVGPWFLESKGHEMTRYPGIPKELKAPYAVTKTEYRMKIEKLG